jgi:hypothetical protein
MDKSVYSEEVEKTENITGNVKKKEWNRKLTNTKRNEIELSVV